MRLKAPREKPGFCQKPGFYIFKSQAAFSGGIGTLEIVKRSWQRKQRRALTTGHLLIKDLFNFIKSLQPFCGGRHLLFTMENLRCQ